MRFRSLLCGRSAAYFWPTVALIAVSLPFLAAQARDVLVNPNFTGTIYIVKENSTGTFAHFRFEPGAHTKWHFHEMGQVILCEEGVCRSQLKGGPVIELHTGETTYVPPGVPHWQGAAPKEGGTQFNVQRGTTNWLEEVTEAEYNTPPGSKK
jgi:quercetin dioxygenase-like cupin family protein